MQLVFASANNNKIKEIRAMLPDTFSLLDLADIGIAEEIPETGSTIRENALLKANYVSAYLKKKNTRAAVFADDSGLEVNGLNGAPGVYSARYAGIPKSDRANNEKLLKELTEKKDRSAHFITVIALILNETVHYFEGRIEGVITTEARGRAGFGYDPLFIPDGYTQTFAEFGPEIKNRISHRGIACAKFVEFLNSARGK
jgi:XTP/dITP diphosphohydrolase